jgi:broad specificity phosphatase PhoE
MIQLGCQMAALTVAAGQEDRCDMLLVVRHADAGDKGSWDGPDVGRPVSLEGRRQAEGLVVRLEDYPVDRILCSPTVRCHQTVQPMASDRLLGIEAVAALGVDAGPAEVLALFWDRRLRNAVLCTPWRDNPPVAVAARRRRVGHRSAAAMAQGLNLAAAAHRTTTGPGPLSGAVDPWQPHGNRLAPPRTSDTAEREELA